MLLVLIVFALIATALAAQLGVRFLRERPLPRRGRRSRASELNRRYDPGRERRAERRARELLRSCVNEEEWGMYRDLGFIRVAGALRTTGSADGEGADRLGVILDERRPDADGGESGEPDSGVAYAYLIYPHKPLVAYIPESGRLLSEYCVEFPDVGAHHGSRLPASDDVLAKWMALTSDEKRVVADANMHLVGHQLDPGRVRRDIWRLAQWQRRRLGDRSARAS
jgi:hypothetical protein